MLLVKNVGELCWQSLWEDLIENVYLVVDVGLDIVKTQINVTGNSPHKRRLSCLGSELLRLMWKQQPD